MTYRVSIPSSIRTIEDLRSWIQRELETIEREFAQTDLLTFNPAFRAPVKIRDGMLIYADGVSFNPGAGAGTYERRGGAWVKL